MIHHLEMHHYLSMILKIQNANLFYEQLQVCWETLIKTPQFTLFVSIRMDHAIWDFRIDTLKLS